MKFLKGFLSDKKALCLTLAVLAVFFAVAAAIWIQARSSSQGKTAAIYQDGQLLRRIPLTDKSEESIKIKSSSGGYNTFQTAGGKIGITAADCPDKLCVKMGMISSTGCPISCLPHKLVIQIEDAKEESPIDATTR